MDSHREAFLTADCCHLPARRSQVLVLPRLHQPATAALPVGEIFVTDDISLACRCAAPPDHTRLACASPSSLLTARCARLVTGRRIRPVHRRC